MATAKGQNVRQDILRLLALLQQRSIEEIEREWQDEGTLAFLISGELTIRIMPIDISASLGEYYRLEAAVARAL